MSSPQNNDDLKRKIEMLEIKLESIYDYQSDVAAIQKAE